MNLSDFYSFWDIFWVPLYLLVTLFFAYLYANRKKEENPVYRYFLPGLMVKIAGGLLFTAIYTFYYKGGDCHAYFWSAKSLVNLLFKEPDAFFSILRGNTTRENWSFFDFDTGFPTRTMYFKGGENFAVPRFMVPFALLGFNDMLLATILLDIFAFWGLWQFFKMVAHLFPSASKHLAIAVLFVPSILFWGSGIMKDSFTLTATLWAIKNMFSVFIMKKKILGNAAMLVVNILTIISMKPYIAIALIPCLALAWTHQWITRIKNPVLGFYLSPVLIAVGLWIGVFSLSIMSSRMGTYSSVENIVSKAQINQKDLIRSEEYGTHSFDIGAIDASPSTMLFKAPVAIIAGIYRPFLWEAGNVVMLISGLENTLILFFTLFILWKSGWRRVINKLRHEPFLLFSLTFSLIFAFSVGVSTANFGALVRYKIPGIPLFLCTLAILWDHYRSSMAARQVSAVTDQLQAPSGEYGSRDQQ